MFLYDGFSVHLWHSSLQLQIKAGDKQGDRDYGAIMSKIFMFWKYFLIHFPQLHNFVLLWSAIFLTVRRCEKWFFPRELFQKMSLATLIYNMANCILYTYDIWQFFSFCSWHLSSSLVLCSHSYELNLKSSMNILHAYWTMLVVFWNNW